MDPSIVRADGAHGPASPSAPPHHQTFAPGAAPLAGLGEQTIRAYSRDYTDFAGFIGVPDGPTALEALTTMPADEAHDRVLAYRAHLERRGLSSATVARRINALRAAVRRARMTGMIGWVLEVPAPRVERRVIRGPGAEEFARMLDELDRRRDPKGMRDRCILRLIWGLTLRRSELVAIDLEDLEFDGDQVGDRITVQVWGRPGKRWRDLTPGTRTALEEWLAVRGRESGPLFYSLHLGRPGGRLTADAVHDIVCELGEKAKLERPIRPQSLRHAG
jgi:site-specific recombinase XerC